MKGLKEFLNLRGHECTVQGDYGIFVSFLSKDRYSFYPVKEIELGKKTVLYQQVSVNNGESYYVVVPGFKASEEYQTKFGASAIKVKEIKDKKMKKDISTILRRKKARGEITFW